MVEMNVDNKTIIITVNMKQQNGEMPVENLLAHVARAALKVGGESEVLRPYIEEELVSMRDKELARRERDASRKRVARLCKKIMTASSPEEVARIKAERYPDLTVGEIKKVEMKIMATKTLKANAT